MLYNLFLDPFESIGRKCLKSQKSFYAPHFQKYYKIKHWLKYHDYFGDKDLNITFK